MKFSVDGVLYRIGENFFQRLERNSDIGDCKKIDNIPSDKIINITIRNITTTLMILSFFIGFIAAVPSLIFTEYYRESLTDIDYYLILTAIIILSTTIELIILYGFILYSTYTISLLLGYDDFKEKTVSGISLKDVLINLSLELDEPIFTYMDINPEKYKPKVLIILSGIIYKLKIVLSSFILKLIVKKLMTRVGIKIYLDFINVIVNAVWDMVTTYLIIKNIKYRIFAYYIGEYTFEHILNIDYLQNYSDELKEALFRIISILVVNSNYKSFNNTLFLAKFKNKIEVTEDLDNIKKFLNIYSQLTEREKHIVKTISALQIAIDGEVNRKEKKILLEFATEYELEFAQSISQLLKENRVNRIAEIMYEKLHTI